MTFPGQRFPNADFPEAYDEANMVKATDVSVNEDGGLLTVDEADPGFGPLMEEVTGADVRSIPDPTAGVEPTTAETVEVDDEAAE